MSSSAFTLAARRLANPARPILTASTSAPTPQSYFLLHHSPGCPAGSRLRWPCAHLRSMHTHIPRSITHEVVGAYLGLWKRQTRAFACGGLLQLKRTQYPSRPKVPEEDFEENFVKGRCVAFLFTSPSPPLSPFLSFGALSVGLTVERMEVQEILSSG